MELTTEHLNNLAVAQKCSETMEALGRFMDTMLEPIAKDVMKTNDATEIRRVASLMPTSFQRMELRTYANQIDRPSQ